jgi:hypothetical protein
VKGNASGGRPEWRPATLLALGFAFSAVVVFAALWLAGQLVLGASRDRASLAAVAAGLLAVLLGVDAVRARGSGATGPSWRRQTPKRFEYRYGSARAALLWGLDAGLVFTTFRVTSLSWAALTVALLGLVPWWAGAAYAFGFAAPILVLIAAMPRRTDPTGRTDPEPVWLTDRLVASRGVLKVAALAVLAAACLSCLALAVQG